VLSNKRGQSTDFPFKIDTRFLNFEGETLFQKLFVIQSPLDNNQNRGWGDLVTAGMRFASFDGKRDSARSIIRQLLDQTAAHSEPQNTPINPIGTSTMSSATLDKLPTDSPAAFPDDPAHALCVSQAVADQRHAAEVVILLVGHSGHGKSKTINRLVGQNLLPVGKTTVGSTTKVRMFLSYSSRVIDSCIRPSTESNYLRMTLGPMLI
jgi:hypothetical protein